MIGTFNALAYSDMFRLLGFLCIFIVASASTKSDCNIKQCKGPIRYLEELKCKPIYEKPSDCCAVSYDCSHLNGQESDKCYINGHVYNVGDKLRTEDSTEPCTNYCTCQMITPGVAVFSCGVAECFNRVKDGCFFKKKPGTCCDGIEVCPRNSDNFAKCVVDGYPYLEGMEFYPKENGDLTCTCLPGYKGENVQPFCKRTSCGAELRHGIEIRNNYPPVFYSNQSPQTDCALGFRWQNARDKVIHSPRRISQSVSENNVCKFGNLTLQIGDELNKDTDYSSVCTKCICEVPPLLTCQQLPHDVCDVTVHGPF